MKTVIIMPSEAECEIIARDAQGREVSVSTIEIIPTFYTPKATPGVLFFETRCDDFVEEDESGKGTDVEGKLLQRGTINLSGATGKLTVGDRTKSVRSRLEETMEEVEAAGAIAETAKAIASDEEPVVVRRKKNKAGPPKSKE